MKEIIKNLISSTPNILMGRNITREYLQSRILKFLQESGAMIPLAFHGGTALRFLFNINRYSEELDFALEQEADHYNFVDYLEQIQNGFNREGYATEIKVNDKGVVHKAFVKFPGLLFELGISNHRNEVISVKLEVDTKPPQGAILETSIVRKHVILNIHHHDRSSLLSGKLHAVLQRPHTKGRDIFDLLWYLSDKTWPNPNLVLLNTALVQSGWKGQVVTKDSWKNLIKQHIQNFNWKEIQTDLRPFLESENELNLVTKQNLEKLL